MEPRWSDDLLRNVLALAVRGDLLERFPGGLTPDLFGATSPRGRIAAVLLTYWEKYKARPEIDAIDDILKRQRLSAGEREAMRQEWIWILDVELPDDPRYLYDKVGQWIEYQRLGKGLLDAGDLLDKGPENIAAARELIKKAARTIESAADLITVNLADVESRPVEWLWPGRIPRGGLSQLIGDPGGGKSKVSLDLAARLSRAAPWPDGVRGGSPGATIYLSAEDNAEQTIRPRFDAMDGDASRVTLLVAARDNRQFSITRDLAALESLLEKTGAVFVIIDPLNAYLGEKVDSHQDADSRRVLGPVAALAERRKVAILGVMHLTKDSKRRALYRAQGNIAFAAAPRSVLAVAEDRGNPDRRFLAHIKNNLGRKQPTLAFTHPDDFRVEWEREPVEVDVEGLFQPPKADEAPMRQQAEAFLRDILANGEVRATEIWDAAKINGITTNTLKRAKATLRIGSRTTGKVGTAGMEWVWFLPRQSGNGIVGNP